MGIVHSHRHDAAAVSFQGRHTLLRATVPYFDGLVITSGKNVGIVHSHRQDGAVVSFQGWDVVSAL